MSEKDEREARISGKSMLDEIDTLWDYSDPSGSERTFQRVLHGPNANNVEFRAQVLTQIARCQILQRRMDDGHATLDKTAQILSDQTPIAHIRYWLERGRAWNDAGRLADATAAFVEAFERAQTVGSDLLCVDAAHMLGVVPPYDMAVIWNQRAIAIAERSADESSGSTGGSGSADFLDSLLNLLGLKIAPQATPSQPSIQTSSSYSTNSNGQATSSFTATGTTTDNVFINRNF